jgi:hypothetical protein
MADEPAPWPHVPSAKEWIMTGKSEPQDLPTKDQKEIGREAQKNREKLNETPDHGTDPLHEGP